MLLSQMPATAVTDLNEKSLYNIMMVFIVISTWARFAGILLVVQSVSKLLMTIFKMLGSAGTFLGILTGYLLVMSTIAIALFQESSITYSTIAYTIRTLFDAMLGTYSYDIQSEYATLHSWFMMFHVFFSNVFMLNYLVAILSTVYEQMMEKGDFAFKCNKYKYIERYNIAFQDQWGYKELIVHPPPLNIGVSLLIGSVLDKNVMQSSGRLFSIINFWLENTLFIS